MGLNSIEYITAWCRGERAYADDSDDMGGVHYVHCSSKQSQRKEESCLPASSIISRR